MPVRGVIFDMGGTLLHYNAPDTSWEETEQTGARPVYALLRDAGYALPTEEEALARAWQHALSLWAAIAELDVKDLKLDRQIRQIAALWGIADLPDGVVEQAGLAYMRAIQAHVWPLERAADTLATLRQRGLRVGLVSNTHWPGRFHVDDLERFGLLPYLEHMVFSADVEAWKPGREVFELSLNALGLAPGEAIYVGDSLYFDVWGAQQAGLRAVWIEQRYRWMPDGLEATPDATIQSLGQLATVVEQWR
mgnify:CR=1 FL=1